MRRSNGSFLSENKCNALDMDYGTVTQRQGGQSWKYEYPRHIRQHSSSIYRQSRNISSHDYTLVTDPNTQNLPVMSTESQGKVCPISLKTPWVSTINEVTQINVANICQKLEQRLNVAKEKGDEFLISLLEKEYEDLSPICINFS